MRGRRSYADFGVSITRERRCEEEQLRNVRTHTIDLREEVFSFWDAAFVEACLVQKLKKNQGKFFDFRRPYRALVGAPCQACHVLRLVHEGISQQV